MSDQEKCNELNAMCDCLTGVNIFDGIIRNVYFRVGRFDRVELSKNHAGKFTAILDSGIADGPRYEVGVPERIDEVIRKLKIAKSIIESGILENEEQS